MKSYLLIWPTLAVGMLAAGCASQRAGENEEPVAELTRARTLVEQAEAQGARQYAAAEIEAALQKLQLADEAIDEGETTVARMRAAEAAADAELAVALAARGEAEASAEEVAAGVDTLRRESARPSPGSTAPSRSLQSPRGNDPVGLR